MDLMNIVLEELIPSPFNPRGALSTSESALASLAASIKTQGVLQPLLVRPLGDQDDAFEIVCGHRRWKAANMLGLDTVPCLVMTMSDDDVIDAMVAENLQREDIHPLEEAATYGLYMDRGWTIEAIGERIGKSAAYVRRRVELLDLADVWRDAACDETSNVSRWPIAHLERVAALPASSQKWLYEHLNHYHTGDPFLLARGELRSVINEMQHRLDGAIWDLDDETLVPVAGACNGCPKRSDHEPALWDALADVDDPNNDGPGDAVCLYAACWESKRVAHVAAVVAAQQQKHSVVVAVENRWDEDAPKQYGAETVSSYDYIKAKASDPEAVRMVHADGPKAGKVECVKPIVTSSNKADKPKASDDEKRARRVVKALVAKLESVAEAAGAGSIDMDFDTTLSAEEKLVAVIVTAFEPQRHWLGVGPSGCAEACVEYRGKDATWLIERAFQLACIHIAEDLRKTVKTFDLTDMTVIERIHDMCEMVGIDFEDAAGKRKGDGND